MAGGVCPTLMQKSVTMHVLRHSAAMRLLLALRNFGITALRGAPRSNGARPPRDTG
jgi:hypothetical protein